MVCNEKCEINGCATILYLEKFTPKYPEKEESAYGNAGWYWHDTEYPEEGLCGPFATKEAAMQHAEGGYDAIHVEARGDAE